jgi:predicted negative regulator of RcsB-dependent stress response
VIRAYVSAAGGRVDAALRELEGAIAKAPRAPELQFFAGDLYARDGQRSQAIASYRRAVDWGAGTGPNPVVPVARVRLAALLHESGDTAGAREQLDVLLAQWKDADTEFPLLIEARRLKEVVK